VTSAGSSTSSSSGTWRCRTCWLLLQALQRSGLLHSRQWRSSLLRGSGQ
jgi:hypothetical protein